MVRSDRCGAPAAAEPGMADGASAQHQDEEPLVNEPIISVSGLRGVIGESLTPEFAMRFACAFAGGLAEGPIVITRDGRASGTMLADAVRAGLCAVGRTVLDAEIAATPTTGVLVRQHAAAGGIQISASHNPPQYNGLKLFDGRGQVIAAEMGQRVTERFRGGEIHWVGPEHLGTPHSCPDRLARHAELVLATVDVDRIQKSKYRVLLAVIIEVNRGAPGAKVTSIARQAASAHPEPTGRFALAPLPTSSLPPDEQPLGASDKLLASPIIEPEVETPRPLEVLGPLEEDSAVARGDAPAPAAAHIQGTDQVVTPVPEGRLTAGAKSAAEPQAGGRAEAEKGAVDDGGSGQPSEMRSWEAERPKGRAQVFVFIDGRSAWREFAPSSSCRPGRYMVRIVVGGGVIREARPVGGAASAVPSQRLCAAELIRGLEIENVADGEYPAEVVVERRGVGVEGPG